MARLAGRGERRPLLLMSHLDVVPAVAADWQHEPFGGDIIDDEIWGRGTQDTKGLTAIWVALLVHAKRSGILLDRDLIFAATADEETGGALGMRWLVENRFDLIDCEFALNEGGGTGMTIGGKTVYTYQTAEKGICPVKLTARGTAGHASIPHIDNPVVHLAEAIRKIGQTHLPIHVTDTLELFIRRTASLVGGDLGSKLPGILEEETAESTLNLLNNETHANTLRAMSRNTASPTILQGGEKRNVIPQTAAAEIDCRVLPGQTAETLAMELGNVLGLRGDPSDKIHVEVSLLSTPTQSAPDTELSRAIAEAVARHDPGAGVAPFLMPAGTDGRFLREKGITCYGFFPTLPDVDTRTVHGKDERLPISSVDFGLRVLWDVIIRVAG